MKRSAVVFGARNLGRAVIELLVSDGWAVTGAARSQSTLDSVTASGALALEADVTDPTSVYDVLEQATAAHGGVDLVVNAAAAYGGERSGPFGGGPIAEADLSGFDSWTVAPARSAFSFLSASGRWTVEQGRAATLVQVTGGSTRRAMPGAVSGRRDRSASEHARGRARATSPGHPGRVADRRRWNPTARRVDASRHIAGCPRRPTQDRGCRALPGQPGRALRDTRGPAHPTRGELDTLTSPLTNQGTFRAIGGCRSEYR